MPLLGGRGVPRGLLVVRGVGREGGVKGLLVVDRAVRLEAESTAHVS
jgi:hypothetical protein